jgi:predicted DNA-binding transcriptional regulator YafY
MSATATRALQLLSLLQNRRYWPGAELAARLEVSARTLRRDVDRLREMGYPVEAQRGVDGGYQLAAGAALPPLVLSDEEAVALAVGLQSAVQSGSVVGIEESAVRALSKIVQVMPPRLRHQVDALAAMTVPAVVGSDVPSADSGALSAIAQACRDCERLTFTYTARGGEPSDRHVDPHRLVLLGRRWYLVAWDLERFDWRTFRLDRLASPHGTGAHFHPRAIPTGDAAQFVRDAIDNLPTRHGIEVVIHASAELVRDRIGRWAAIEDLGNDRCLLGMTSESLDWPMMVLGATGADFEVLSPSEFLVHLGERVARFSRSIEGPGRTNSRAPGEHIG